MTLHNVLMFHWVDTWPEVIVLLGGTFVCLSFITVAIIRRWKR